MDSSTLRIWTGSFQEEGVYEKFVLLSSVIEIPVFNANSVDPDQTPRFAASNLGLLCLRMSLLWDARHKLVNPI